MSITNDEAIVFEKPRILIVDDERQIHASLRLRLGKHYELVYCFDAQEGLAAISIHPFDLCFADVNMPKMDGLAFIAAAQHRDPNLGFVILSAFDSEENLRRAIPLQTYDFIGKPFPARHAFEALIPEWVERTRTRRREQLLASQVTSLDRDLDSARLERDVELVASETAREALLQTANLLSTLQAYLAGAMNSLTAKTRSDPGSAPLLRTIEQAVRTADAATSVAEGYFNSAYANRDESPALVDTGVDHAISIAKRLTHAEAANKEIDFSAINTRMPISSLSGIDFLLMMVPLLGTALTLAGARTTVRLKAQSVPRLDAATKSANLKGHLWVNRKYALTSQPGVLFNVTAAAPSLSRADVDAWLKGAHSPVVGVSPRGLVSGLKKSRGLLAISLSSPTDVADVSFNLVLVLPT